MDIRGDIEHAIYSHGQWKARFRDFLNGRAGLDLSTVGDTHDCVLGRWLDDGGRRMLSAADHAEACRLHTHFHHVAGEIVRNIKQKDYQAARAAVASAGSFDQASHELAAFLRKVVLRAIPRGADKASAAADPPGEAPASPPAA